MVLTFDMKIKEVFRLYIPNVVARLTQCQASQKNLDNVHYYNCLEKYGSQHTTSFVFVFLTAHGNFVSTI